MMDASVVSGGSTRSSLISVIRGVLTDVALSELPRRRGVSQNLRSPAGATVANEHPRYTVPFPNQG